MNFSDLRTNVRRIVEDDGLRWDDTAIAEYLVAGVNEIFRKTGGVTDTVPFDLIKGESEYVFAEDGRITTVRLLPENSTRTKTLQQVQVEELPIDFTQEADPTCYALSQVAIQGDSEVLGVVGGSAAVLADQGVVYTALTNGTAGNSITIELVDPLSSSSPLSISVISNAISVDLETDGGGTIVTTVGELVTELVLHSGASDLIAPTGSGTSVISALAPTNLAGGIDEPTISSEGPGDLTRRQKILFDRSPSRSTSGYVGGGFGFYVDSSKEWTFVSAPVATSELTTVIPVLPKFDRPLTNLVAGAMLSELNDNQLAQRGYNMMEIAKQTVGNLSYVDSISKYSYSPNRQFP